MPKTVEKNSFRLSLMYNLDNDKMDENANFGKGGSFSHSLTFQDVDETQFNVIDFFGNKRVFIKEEDF